MPNVTCDDIALQNILAIVKGILAIVQICGPILCIISIAFLITKLVINPEDKDKKLIKDIRNSAIALVILFFIPVIVTALMNTVDPTSNLAACWKNSSSFKTGGSTYIPSNDEPSNGFIIPASEYDTGNKANTDTNSSNTGQSSKNDNLKVLFVGNSMTYRGTSSQQISVITGKMLKSGGYNWDVYTANKSSSTLTQVMNAKKTLMTQRKYDIAILQENTSRYESKNNSSYLNDVKKVKALLKKKNPNIKIYVRQKWVSKGRLKNSSIYYANAVDVASKTGSYLIYDGKAWDKSRSLYPNLNLYADNIHQSKYGAFLAAACAYKTITGSNPEEFSYSEYVGKSNAKKLAAIANQVCY